VRILFFLHGGCVGIFYTLVILVIYYFKTSKKETYEEFDIKEVYDTCNQNQYRLEQVNNLPIAVTADSESLTNFIYVATSYRIMQITQDFSRMEIKEAIGEIYSMNQFPIAGDICSLNYLDQPKFEDSFNSTSEDKKVYKSHINSHNKYLSSIMKSKESIMNSFVLIAHYKFRTPSNYQGSCINYTIGAESSDHRHCKN
jgi:D-Tyr-tRNAtyr deacylase